MKILDICIIFLIILLINYSTEISKENFKNLKNNLEKYNLIKLNKNLLNNTLEKECNWCKESLIMRKKYIGTMQKDITYYNRFMDLYSKFNLPYVFYGGSILTMIRGLGYLKGDDIDIDFLIDIPEKIIKNRSIKDDEIPYLNDDNKKRTHKNSDKNYERKIATLILINKLLENGAKWLKRGTTIIGKKEGFYFEVVWPGYIYLRLCVKGVSVLSSDITYHLKSGLKEDIRKFGNYCHCNVDKRKIIAQEGYHKRAQYEFGPTYMKILKCYPYGLTPELISKGWFLCPKIDEWNKEWQFTDFKEEQTYKKYWDEVNKKYMK
jgi:hypothetical protein